MLYKITIEKTLFVEADSEEEANELCFDDISAYNKEEQIVSTVPVDEW